MKRREYSLSLATGQLSHRVRAATSTPGRIINVIALCRVCWCTETRKVRRPRTILAQVPEGSVKWKREKQEPSGCGVISASATPVRRVIVGEETILVVSAIH